MADAGTQQGEIINPPERDEEAEIKAAEARLAALAEEEKKEAAARGETAAPAEQQLPSTAVGPAGPGGGEVAMYDSRDLTGGSLGLALWFDDHLLARVEKIARYMCKARGMVPNHLLGAPAVCFAVITRALTWKLDPYFVAANTYEPVPGGRVGYQGALCAAILENSGRLEGGVEYEHYGRVMVQLPAPDSRIVPYKSNDPRLQIALAPKGEDAEGIRVMMGGTEQEVVRGKGLGGVIIEEKTWDDLVGMFEMKVGNKGKKYPSATWTDKDAMGLGVTVMVKVRGQNRVKHWDLDLVQCQPRNSTLWATDPRTQICYTAVRRFGNVVVPGIFAGVPFDRGDSEAADAEPIDITPRQQLRHEAMPTRAAAAEAKATATTETAKPKESPAGDSSAANGGAQAQAPEAAGKGGGAAPASPPASAAKAAAQAPSDVDQDDEAEWTFYDFTGIGHECKGPADFAQRFLVALNQAGAMKALEALWENNSPLIVKIPEQKTQANLRHAYDTALTRIENAAKRVAPGAAAPAKAAGKKEDPRQGKS